MAKHGLHATSVVVCTLTVSAAFVIWGCSISLAPGLTGLGGEQLAFTIGLGSTGIFTVNTGIPVSNSALFTGGQVPASASQGGALRLDGSEITVTPLSAGQSVPISGSLSINFKMGAGTSLDPCTEGVDLGTLQAVVTEGAVSLSGSLTLPAQALAYLADGSFTLCITLTADFDAVVVVGDIQIVFDDAPNDQDGGSEDNENDGGTITNENFNDNANVTDNVNDNQIEVNVNENDDATDNVDGLNENENEATDVNDNDGGLGNDNAAGASLTYVNLTNDLDQNPDSGFDATNHYPSVSADGNVIAYLSDVDTTGEGGQTPNNEVMVLLGYSKVQITHTTETTNTSNNTYDVTNWGPMVSRDGSAIAFASDGDLLGLGYAATDQIYLYEVGSTELRQLSLLDTPSGLAVRDLVQAPRVSADGNVVAWVETDAECQIFGCAAQTRLRVTDRTGGDLVTVVYDATISFDDYALSGDGSTIVFVSSYDPVGQNPGGRQQLFLLGVPGGSITQVSALAASGGDWTPYYRAPGISDDGSVLAAWTNDPAVAGSEEMVLALLDSGGGLIRILAQAGVDFPSGDDDPGRPRISEDGGYVAFRTAWTFAYSQRNFRAATYGDELLDVGVGYKTNSPGITADGGLMIVAGIGNAFYPDQTFQNEDWTDEIWQVWIAP